LIATPVTLVALLKAVAYGWRQEKLAESAREISSLGKQVYERVSVLWDHLDNLARALTAAVNAFNKAVGSFETRLLPGIGRFKDLGATAAEPIPPLEVVEPTPRLLGPLPEAEKADRENGSQD
jgi:DNA recombination protein RmuC